MASKQRAARRAVLVTRPAGQSCDTLCAALTAHGYAAHSQPLLELHPLPELPPPLRKKVEDLDLYQHVIFVSGNAVRFGMAHIEAMWPQLPVGIQWYAIGCATAARLEEVGITAHTPAAQMSSEGLLALPQLQAIKQQRVLLVKGQGGRDTLARELARRGAAVDELACYRREPVQLPAGEMAKRLHQWQIDAVLISSGEGLANWQVLLSPTETTNFKHLRLIVPSQRVARLAQDAGFVRIEAAENASDAAMIRALQESEHSSGD